MEFVAGPGRAFINGFQCPARIVKWMPVAIRSFLFPFDQFQHPCWRHVRSRGQANYVPIWDPEASTLAPPAFRGASRIFSGPMMYDQAHAYQYHQWYPDWCQYSCKAHQERDATNDLR